MRGDGEIAPSQAAQETAAARADAWSRFVLWWALGVGLLLIVVNLTRWDLVQLLTPFLEPILVELPAHGALLLAAVGSLVVLPGGLRYGGAGWRSCRQRSARRQSRRSSSCRSTDIISDRDFYDHRAERERVVTEIATGTLRPNVSHNPRLIRLPRCVRAIVEGRQ